MNIKKARYKEGDHSFYDSIWILDEIRQIWKKLNKIFWDILGKILGK